MHASLPLSPVRTLATAASALILLVCAANLYGTWAAWNAHSVVADYVADLPGVTDDDLFAADSATVTALWVSVLAVAAAAAVFLTWLWRARVNSERISGVHHRLSRGWTIGAWFCPVVNLWFPRRIVDDVWRASRPGVPADQHLIDPLPLSPLVRAWWLVLIGNYAIQYLVRVQSNGAVTVDYFKTLAVYSTLSSLLLIVAGVLLIKVIHQITEWQSAPPRVAPDGAAHQQAPLS